MHPIDWLIVFVLNGSVIGLGFYIARGTISSSEWFLGKRSLPWWAIGLSMFATNVDNADIVSVSSKTFSTGLHIISVYAIGSVIGGILAAFLVVPAMYRAGFFTNSEYLEARFGVTARVLSALIQIQYRTSMLGLMLYAVFVLLTGLNIMGPTAAWILIVTLVVCSGIYTAWGGLKTVVWTDAMQGILMMVGSLVILAAIWNVVGGWSGMVETLAAQDAVGGTNHSDLTHIGKVSSEAYSFQLNNKAVNLGPFIVVIGWTIIGCGYWTVNHTQTMRLMGARSLWDMRMAAMFGVAISLPVMIGIALLGLFGRAIPEFASLEQTPDQLYPQMVDTFLGVGLKGLVVAGVVAATISTVDSMGSALSAIFTRDIYARLITNKRSDRHYVTVSRWTTVVILMLGFAYLPFILMQKNMLDAFTTLIPVFVTPLLTMYVLGALTRVHRRSGMIGLAAGSLYGIFALYCREAPRLEWYVSQDIPLWLTDRWAALSWSFLITAVTMFAVTGILGRETEPLKMIGGQTGWLQRSSEALPKLIEHPFRDKIPWWANSYIYAVILTVICFYVVFRRFW